MFALVPQQYPPGPGCYLMKDAAGAVIYVGKAKNLRRRISSYFNKQHQHWRTRELVKRITDIDVILVRNETESLVLENNLIKYYQPRFNAMLVDEKSGYGYLAMTDEVLPRLVPYKKHWVNKEVGDAVLDRVFGPYLSGAYRYTLQGYANDRFQLRNCNPLPKRVCIRYEIGTCTGACAGKVTEAQYLTQVRKAASFLQSSHHAVLRDIRKQVEEASEAMAFERAQRFATLLPNLEGALQNQVVERDVSIDQHVIYSKGGSIFRLRIQHGVLLFAEWFAECGMSSICAEGQNAQDIPQEIITNQLEPADEWAGCLQDSTWRYVRVTVPRRGIKRTLLDIAALNHTYREQQRRA